MNKEELKQAVLDGVNESLERYKNCNNSEDVNITFLDSDIIDHFNKNTLYLY